MEKVLLVKKSFYVETGAVLTVKHFWAEKVMKGDETVFSFMDKGKKDYFKQSRIGKNFKTDTLIYCQWSVE